MLQIEPPSAPPDFDGFWRATHAEAMRVQPNITRRPSEHDNAEAEVEEVYFDAWGDVRLGGWFVRPRHTRPTRSIVYSHGYGGRSAPEAFTFDPPANVLYYCARGFHLSRVVGLPYNESAAHVIHGLASRDTYLHRGCAADVWAAASALIELAPDTADRLQYIGSSYGGGIGALALPWDARFSAAALRVPSFGHHPIRLCCSCIGSGEHVREYCRRHGEAVENLRYYDSAIAATRLAIPTHVTCARFDPAVPPPGQFAVYNAIAGPKRLAVIPAGHFNAPGGVVHDQRAADDANDWLAER